MYFSKPFITFHQINAFEDQGCIVIDLCCQDDGRILEVYQLQNLRKTGKELDQVEFSDLLRVVKIIFDLARFWLWAWNLQFLFASLANKEAEWF